MQDIHSVRGGWRFFVGSGGGDPRLRPHQHPNQHALKCPRCDSLNTKFCYYNNYNFSQPRHFCKACRRYWTKGGVLRNVLVGGGCRKTKRSKTKKIHLRHRRYHLRRQNEASQHPRAPLQARPPLLTTGSARLNSVEELSVAKSKYNPGGKRGSKAKLKSGSVSSPSNSSNSSPESAIFSPSKQNPDKKQRSKPKPKSRSFHSPPDSSNLLTDSPSPPRKSGCLWCSPKTKRASHTKSIEKEAIDFGAGLNFSNDDRLLSDLGSFWKKEQTRRLSCAGVEEKDMAEN
ncbi:hypothetical protein ACFX13_040588 [Malus domestica]